jgi:DNA gyrase subunit A
MGRTSAGVRGIKLRQGDEVVSLLDVNTGEESILTVCENGYGKRTNVAEYRLQKRAGYGIINIKVTERNGVVVGVRSVSMDDEFMMITRGGMVVRTRVADCREIGRNTQGVTVMDVDEGDVIQSIALVAESDIDEDAETAGETDAPEGALSEGVPTSDRDDHGDADEGGDADDDAGDDADEGGDDDDDASDDEPE